MLAEDHDLGCRRLHFIAQEDKYNESSPVFLLLHYYPGGNTRHMGCDFVGQVIYFIEI